MPILCSTKDVCTGQSAAYHRFLCEAGLRPRWCNGVMAQKEKEEEEEEEEKKNKKKKKRGRRGGGEEEEEEGMKQVMAR
jgi:hypothetical protein